MYNNVLYTITGGICKKKVNMIDLDFFAESNTIYVFLLSTHPWEIPIWGIKSLLTNVNGEGKLQ